MSNPLRSEWYFLTFKITDQEVHLVKKSGKWIIISRERYDNAVLACVYKEVWGRGVDGCYTVMGFWKER